MMRVDDMRAIVAECQFPGWTLEVLQRHRPSHAEKPYLQVHVASGKCNVTGGEFAWGGRKWFLSGFMTKSELVQTAFLAVMTAMEHEVREQFTYRGETIFQPHFDVDQMVGFAQDRKNISEREPPKLVNPVHPVDDHCVLRLGDDGGPHVD